MARAWNAITRDEPSPHGDILLNATTRLGALRAGDFKLVHHRPARNARRPRAAKGFQLYNLRDDLGETHDLARAQPEILAHLKRRLTDYRKAATKSLGGAGRPPVGFKVPARWGHPDKR